MRIQLLVGLILVVAACDPGAGPAAVPTQSPPGTMALTAAPTRGEPLGTSRDTPTVSATSPVRQPAGKRGQAGGSGPARPTRTGAAADAADRMPRAQGQQAPVRSGCPVSAANGAMPPAPWEGPNSHGNDLLWTQLWPGGVVMATPDYVRPDGSVRMKWPWWRGVAGELAVEGRRLDAPAPPLRAEIPPGYGAGGFQPSALIFPTDGCWEVTARVGGASLTFVTQVRKVDGWP